MLRRYAHLSTGSYNPRTARLYTDIGYLTADSKLTEGCRGRVPQLASLGKTRPLRRMLQAPFTALHAEMLACVQRVARRARSDRPARIVLKINALTDAALIGALVDAGQAGAEIDLVVRGPAACRRPAWQTERIRVRSIVERFRAHAVALLPLGRRRRRREVLYPDERRTG